MTLDLEAAHLYAETSPLISHTPYLAALDEIARWKTIALRQAKRSVGFKLAARRHRGTIDAQAKRIAELELILSQSKQVIDGLQKTDAELREESQKRYERIAELEVELSRSYQFVAGMARVGNEYPRIISEQDRQITKQRAALKKLGKALVEERARHLHYIVGETNWHNLADCCKNDWRRQAYHQLRLEGLL